MSYLGTTVRLHLDVEAMRYQIVHAFTARQEEVEREIDRLIVEEIQKLDFQKIVVEEFQQIFRDAVRKAITYTVSNLLHQGPINETIRSGAQEKIASALRDILDQEKA